MRVLDVAAGNGNAAVEAARAGAEAVASDFAPKQVAQGRERTAAEGLDIEWVEADAEELPFEDGSFDAVVSVFGAMFAPRPGRVASELFRVVRPGGVVGMANWRPEGFQAGFFDILRRYRPPDPEGVEPGYRWGEEDCVRERFAPFAESVRVVPSTVPWRFGSLQEMGEFFQSNMPRPPQQLEDEQRERLAAEMLENVQRHNTADDGSVAIDAEYAIVVARKKR
ncbi:MAG: class I SAM-dependent methyltransferase [Actinomycetota bacterium]|nr:class I SAM-dependent methyltransferase [Actinomycetota bacterium]